MPDGEVAPFSPGGAAPPTGNPAPAGVARPPGAAGAAPAPGGMPAHPTGISPATQATGQQGTEMEVRVLANALANRLAEFSGRLGMTSDLGKALHKAAGIIAAAVPKGSIPEGSENAAMQKLMQQQRQNAANIAAMRQGQGGAAGGPPGGPGGIGGAPTPPRPPAMPGAMAA